MGFVANFIRFPTVRKIENRLRFDKVTESWNVAAFLRDSVETLHLSVFGNSLQTSWSVPGFHLHNLWLSCRYCHSALMIWHQCPTKLHFCTQRTHSSDRAAFHFKPWLRPRFVHVILNVPKCFLDLVNITVSLICYFWLVCRVLTLLWIMLGNPTRHAGVRVVMLL